MNPELFDLHAEVELTHWWFVARRAILRRVLASVVPPGTDRVVIDVGCGTGANIAALASDYEVIGIDTTESAIDLARERFPAVPFVCGFAPGDLGPDAARADAFLLMDVLEHVPDDTAVLAPLVEQLSPGGVVLITVPADMRLWSEHDESFGHYRRYDATRLRAAFDGLPVRERLLSPFNARLYPVVRSIRFLSQLRGRAWGRSGSDLDVPAAPINGMLRRIFAGESGRLVDLVAGKGRPFRRGVSLMAVLEREG
ncbi:MAG: class I SAM-dependent methyltransferase [Phycisphaerales bacterium]|nr:class I SAM-dependent methyltransferase [Phycisphaerales bacterium]